MDSIDMQRFYDCVNAKRGKRGIAIIAKEIGVSSQALKDLMEGNISTGFFAPNAKAIGAFFTACDWLGVPANMFLLTEDLRDDGSLDSVSR